MFRQEDLPQTIATGQYTLTELIGQGAMAAVYRAEPNLDVFDYASLLASHDSPEGDPDATEVVSYREQRYAHWNTHDRAQLIDIVEQYALPYPKGGVAAVKVMLPEHKGAELAARFEAEWRQLLALNHENLIQVFGGGFDGRIHWYAMNLVENVFPISECKAQPEMTKLEIVYQAAGGLEELHKRGLVHRDIKPANLLCSRENNQIKVRVMDLGIAKTPDTDGLTLSHHMMGTPYYMSPEQAGSAKRVSALADVYSLGATLYTLATGKRPYEGKAMYEVVGHIIRGDPPAPPLEVSPELNPHIARLIERMMEPDPTYRMQSMREVRKAIQAVLTGNTEQISVLLAGAPARTRPPAPEQKAADDKPSGNVLTRLFRIGRKKKQ